MKIILAVSGGVDSVAMLHSLMVKDGFATLGQLDAEFIVAHFDHGIRADSSADEKFVNELADKYSLKFESKSVSLNKQASEDTARKARWKYLYEIKEKYQAGFIATAHHADDIFETQLINLVRGTGRRGISVLNNTDSVIRPIITKTKKQIYDYAVKNKLEFVEDSTNQDLRYLRNKMRHQIIPQVPQEAKNQLCALFERIINLNTEINSLLIPLTSQIISTDAEATTINRGIFSNLPEPVRLEVLREALQGFSHDKQKISFAMIKRLNQFALRNDSNKDLHLSKTLTAHITKKGLIIKIDYKS